MTWSSPAGPQPADGRWTAAERLLEYLNRWGTVWGSLAPADRSTCDCRLVSRDGSISVDLQIVRTTEASPVPGADTSAEATRLSALVAGAARQASAAAQSRPWLVIDAAGMPAARLNATRREVRNVLRDQTGFRQIWIVGSDPSQVWQAFGPPPADVTAPIW